METDHQLIDQQLRALSNDLDGAIDGAIPPQLDQRRLPTSALAMAAAVLVVCIVAVALVSAGDGDDIGLTTASTSDASTGVPEPSTTTGANTAPSDGVPVRIGLDLPGATLTHAVPWCTESVPETRMCGIRTKPSTPTGRVHQHFRADPSALDGVSLNITVAPSPALAPLTIDERIGDEERVEMVEVQGVQGRVSEIPGGFVWLSWQAGDGTVVRAYGHRLSRERMLAITRRMQPRTDGGFALAADEGLTPVVDQTDRPEWHFSSVGYTRGRATVEIITAPGDQEDFAAFLTVPGGSTRPFPVEIRQVRSHEAIVSGSPSPSGPDHTSTYTAVWYEPEHHTIVSITVINNAPGPDDISIDDVLAHLIELDDATFQAAVAMTVEQVSSATTSATPSSTPPSTSSSSSSSSSSPASSTPASSTPPSSTPPSDVTRG